MTDALAQVNDQTRAEIGRMDWHPASDQHLVTSKSTITDLPDFVMVSGTQAIRFRQIVDGGFNSAIEADAFNSRTDSELVFQYVPVGYVSSDDWKDVNTDDFLAQMKANDEIANKERLQKGLPALRTVGWLQKPTFNDDLHTVSWMIEGEYSTGGHIINAIALKLGRFGLERITWIIDPEKVPSGMNDLLLAENAHIFDAGARYTDYIKSTDKAAGYGIAGLVAGALGVKLLKAGGIAAFLLGFKKIAFVLLLPFIWAGRKLKGILTKV